MFEFSPTHTSVREMQRQELLANVAQYRIVEAACHTQAAGESALATARFTRIGSWGRCLLDALSPVAFGFSSK